MWRPAPGDSSAERRRGDPGGRVSASMCTGRSARRSAPIATSTRHVRHAPPDEPRFAAALARELAHFAALTPGRTVTSIFLGGGTPSLMQAATVATILDTIARLWPVAADAEITLEANPGSAEAERFRGYRAAGVNRLSLGVQSLDDAALKALGRIHDAAEARHAVELAREHLSAALLRPDLCAPGADAARLARGARGSDRHGRRPSLALPAHHRGRRRPSHACTPPESSRCRTASSPRTSMTLTQEVTEARGLPAYEISNHAAPGAREPPQPHLLALPGLCRRRSRRAWPPDRRRRQARDGDANSIPENWLQRVEEDGHGARHRRVADAGRSRRRDAADGPAAARRGRAGALRRDERPQPQRRRGSTSCARTDSSSAPATGGSAPRATAGWCSIPSSPTSPPD